MRTCPYCGERHEGSTKIEGAQARAFDPQPGDIGICISCGEWMVITDTSGGARKPTDEELIGIGLNEDCRRLRLAWTKAKGAAEG